MLFGEVSIVIRSAIPYRHHQEVFFNLFLCERQRVLQRTWTWSSFVEGDAQLDQPNSQTCAYGMFCTCTAYFILGLSQTQQLNVCADKTIVSFY